MTIAHNAPTKEVAVSETNDVNAPVMQTPLIQVVCCAMPNGEALWFEAEKGSEYLSKVIASWKEQHPEFTNTECTMGCIEMRMPIDKYYSIQATNSFNWPA